MSINWAGQPLRTLEILLGWVRGTEVGGEGVTAGLDRATYPTKVKVSDKEMKRLDLGGAKSAPIGTTPSAHGTPNCWTDQV